MELTVGKLKEIIAELPDDTILADLDYGNESFSPHLFIKRVLLLKDRSGRQYLTINRMGAHFTENDSLKFAGKHWD